MEQGRTDHAAILVRDAGDDPRARVVAALLDVLRGRPRTAVRELLAAVPGDRPPIVDLLVDYVRTVHLRWAAPVEAVLTVTDDRLLTRQEARLRDCVRAVARTNAPATLTSPTDTDDGRAPEGHPSSTGGPRPGPAPVHLAPPPPLSRPDLLAATEMESLPVRTGETGFRAVVGDLLDALAGVIGPVAALLHAALACDRERARSLHDAVVSSTSAARIPTLGIQWVSGHLALTRMILFPGAPLLPAGWDAGEAPLRRVFRALSLTVLDVVDGLVHGRSGSGSVGLSSPGSSSSQCPQFQPPQQWPQPQPFPCSSWPVPPLSS
ncbi:hypothetical protein [Brevibacterium litoralis]|uniref:hypothetical protein n=1 Tax=Brevibacterium litoralis TaxID=3138935 RepID=UPI0032EEA37B